MFWLFYSHDSGSFCRYSNKFASTYCLTYSGIAFDRYFMVTMAGDKKSQSSLMCSEVVTDAAHPLFLEPTRKDASSSTSSWRYYCQQCNERLINKDAFLNKHFEKKYHEPVTTCERCKGNIYQYRSRQSHALYHKCKQRGECVCNQNNNNNDVDQNFTSHESHSKAI